jgi:hypothetical protein
MLSKLFTAKNHNGSFCSTKQVTVGLEVSWELVRSCFASSSARGG